MRLSIIVFLKWNLIFFSSTEFIWTLCTEHRPELEPEKPGGMPAGGDYSALSDVLWWRWGVNRKYRKHPYLPVHSGATQTPVSSPWLTALKSAPCLTVRESLSKPFSSFSKNVPSLLEVDTPIPKCLRLEGTDCEKSCLRNIGRWPWMSPGWVIPEYCRVSLPHWLYFGSWEVSGLQVMWEPPEHSHSPWMF